MNYVSRPVRKKDTVERCVNRVYTNDLAPKDCLIVKLLRSPYAKRLGGGDPDG